MNNLEQRVKEAFDAVELPADVRARTLAAISELEQQATTPLAETLTSASTVSYGKPAPGDAAEEAFDPASSAPRSQPSLSAPPQPAKARPKARVHVWRRVAVAMAACFLVAAMGLVGTRLYFQETAYIDIDVNPSLTLGLNRFDIVVSATPLNTDGESLLERVSLTGKPYDKAMTELTQSAAFIPYIKEDAFIGISVTSSDQRQIDKLCAQSDTQLSALPCKGSCSTATTEAREEAHAVGMGSARYQAAEQLVQLDSSLTLEDCASMSMRELRERLARFGVVPETEGQYHGGSGSHQGQGSSQGSGSGQGAENNPGSGKGSGGGAGQGHGKAQGGGNGQGAGRGSGNS